MKSGNAFKTGKKKLDMDKTKFEALGDVQKGAFFDRENGTAMPDAAYLAEIAEAGVEVFYVLTGRRAWETLTNKEKALLAGYQAFSPKGRVEVMNLIKKMFLASQKEQSGAD